MPFILSRLLFIIFSFLHYNSKKIHYINYYAMVSNIYFKQTLKSTEFNRTQVKINRCNKHLLQKIMNCKQNKNKYIKIRNFHFNNISLKQYIHILKNSGCINSINKYTILYIKYKQDIFNVDIYPVINQINITKYKKLKICTKFLQKIFIHQLGLPKNYLLINSILHKIHSWYLSRGYKWSNINIKNTSQINKINLTINEGKIHSVHIECKSKQIKKNTLLMN
uniref:hypothetical protein n=1 Tax=Gracilaria usneoides TaxID=172951 RepID=UPI001D0FB767|nr:hypothetical protein LK225_pgp123 [Crassiphycus usneoides]UAD88622.1 hypothetical protein [Crassiphycus usneoides]